MQHDGCKISLQNLTDRSEKINRKSNLKPEERTEQGMVGPVKKKKEIHRQVEAKKTHFV
jgi:hypothetical protein